ncbi:helix-hairpin-helix domain-containing protein [Clostridium sp. MSJ-8]|uniref:helix-hairpin-helix domain-containing protein n=1 Tax=Clostridium sp. MSJ-8 TaxID=2841510 RepID=UPI001C0F3B4B|nr:helix-hairpin-helix domain-containing protein [Clostridium sp. MSJ-8]MBU5486866.1 helix-hairpin-helix domain-containing protein [Clostridium sp. MSJ-8]
MCKKNYKLIGIGIVIIVIILYVIIGYFSNGKDELIKNNTDSIYEEEGDTELPLKDSKIVVEIKGEVNKPNVYYLEEGCIVQDLIDMAGGITDKGDLQNINRAQELSNHECIVIPSYEENNTIAEGGETISSAVGNNDKVNINTADSTELQTLTGIGESRAQAIIDYREENGRFKSIEEIKNISGIGDKMFEKIKEHITI